MWPRASRWRPAIKGPFSDGVVGRHFEKRPRRFSSGYVGQAVNMLPHSRITVFTQDHDLQIGRVPSFVDYIDRPVVSNLAGRNCESCPRAFGLQTFDRLRAQ